jgi:putative membrane protein
MKLKISGIFFTIMFLVGWSVVIFKTLASGDMLKLVHPRIIPLVIIAACFALVISLCSIARRKQQHHFSVSVLKGIILVISLAVGIFSRPISLNADANSQVSGQTKVSAANEYLSEGIKKIRESDTIRIDGDYYYSEIMDIYDNPDIYSGRTVEITGMLFKRKGSRDPRDCAVIRIMMVCCAADTQAVGLICKYDKAGSVTNKGWYIVSGKIDYVMQGSEKVPCIIVSDALPCDKPGVDYIYPR